MRYPHIHIIHKERKKVTKKERKDCCYYTLNFSKIGLDSGSISDRQLEEDVKFILWFFATKHSQFAEKVERIVREEKEHPDEFQMTNGPLAEHAGSGINEYLADHGLFFAFVSQPHTNLATHAVFGKPVSYINVDSHGLGKIVFVEVTYEKNLSIDETLAGVSFPWAKDVYVLCDSQAPSAKELLFAVHEARHKFDMELELSSLDAGVECAPLLEMLIKARTEEQLIQALVYIKDAFDKGSYKHLIGAGFVFQQVIDPILEKSAISREEFYSALNPQKERDKTFPELLRDIKAGAVAEQRHFYERYHALRPVSDYLNVPDIITLPIEKIEEGETFSQTTVYKELEVLISLGILVKVDDYDRVKKPNYKFSDEFIGPDASHTIACIDAVNSIDYAIGATKYPLHRYDIPERGPPINEALLARGQPTETVPLEFLGRHVTIGNKGTWIYKNFSKVSQTLIDSVRETAEAGQITLNKDQETALNVFEEELQKMDKITLLPANYPNAKHWNNRMKKFKNWRDNIPEMFAYIFVNHRIMAIVNYWETEKDYSVTAKDKQKRESYEELPALLDHLRKLLGESEDNKQAALAALLRNSLSGNTRDLSNWIEKEQGLLVDDTEEASGLLARGVERMDVFVDNVGAELLGDLLLIEYIIREKLADKVVIHTKHHPFFIGDAMIIDVEDTIKDLSVSMNEDIRKIGKTLKKFVGSGQLVIEEDPWLISGKEQIEIPKDKIRDLTGSDLVIVKGEYLYRTFIGNRYYPYDTNINDTVRSLGLPPILLMRMMKEEPAVGVEIGKVKELEEEDPEWYHKGYGFIQLTKDHRGERSFVRKLVGHALDIEYAKNVLDLTRHEEEPEAAEEERSYVIRYNKQVFEDYPGETGIDETYSPKKVLDAYVTLLRSKAKDPDSIVLQPMRGEKEKGIIQVQCYEGRAKSGELIGESHVVIEGSLEGKLLRLVGMLNMAVAASNIPKDTLTSELGQYETLVSFIKQQYKQVTGRPFPSKHVLNNIRRISLNLPTARPERISEYYRIAIDHLERAA